MATSGDDGLEREAREVPRRWYWLASFYAVFALACAAMIPHAYTLEHSGARVARGTVIAIAPLRGGDERIVTQFVDAAGRTRTTDDGIYMAPGARVGDELPVVFSPDSDWARVVNSGERAMRWMFIGFAVGIGTAALVCAALGRRRAARNHWLLRHGTRLAGSGVAVQWRSFGRLPASWRLRASWRDERAFAWREVVGDWQSSAAWQPALSEGGVLVLVDPGRPHRAWLPATGFRQRSGAQRDERTTR